MRSLEEQIKDRINSLMLELTENDENENDKEIMSQIHELKKILDFRIHPPEK